MLNFFTKALIKKQMKGMPEAEVDKLLEIFEKNPDFFTKMASAVQEKMKAGKSQEDAAKEFAMENKDTLKGMLG